MTEKEFVQKLKPFFTDNQILLLDEYAYESAKDAHGDDINCTDELLHFMGREFVCDWLANAEVNEVKSVAGGDITEDQLERFWMNINREV